MKTIKAARIRDFGGPGAVHVESTSLDDPGPGSVLVRVHAAGVNPIDWKVRSGALKEKLAPRLPFTLGGDFSGVVEALNADVTTFKVGDAVYGQASVLTAGSGSFAEFVLARTSHIAAKPRSVSHEIAGALPLAGVSAVQALTEHLRVSKGQRILIHGGAGGIGGFAIQLARHLGAQVATTVSADDIEYAKRLGANQVIDRKKQKFEEVVRNLDAVLDTVGGDTYVRSFRVLKEQGRLVSLLEAPREDLAKEFQVEAINQFTQVNSQRLASLARYVDEGAVKVHIDKAFPLADAAAALQHLEKESPRGKVILKLA
ncbi:MAG TPA: NADP-dependent oxidoreductase [Steroidobacteraceae bacterium]|jgi:NADPH:quinone reductase-like Zn-dependent oxidoreductase